MGRFEDIGHDDDFLRNHFAKTQPSEIGPFFVVGSTNIGIDGCRRRIDEYKRRNRRVQVSD
jgi:hypothetical protein